MTNLVTRHLEVPIWLLKFSNFASSNEEIQYFKVIKKIISNLLFLGSLLISSALCGQKTTPYAINSSIRETVEENIKLTDLSGNSAMKSIETINDTTLPENFGFGKNLDAITQASLTNDTIIITSFLAARGASFGYKFILRGNTCTVKYFSLADENIFKINKADKQSRLITVACQTNKLTLSQKPQFKEGESIEGVVELTTNDFWSTSDGQNTKIKVQLTGYFKTKLSQDRPNEQDVFKQIQ